MVDTLYNNNKSYRYLNRRTETEITVLFILCYEKYFILMAVIEYKKSKC